MNRLDNEEISRMVIKVFFEEEAESKTMISIVKVSVELLWHGREVIPTSSIKAVYDIVDHKSIKKYWRQDKIRFEW